MILSTVTVNLKDSPPFASQHRLDLSAEDLAKWNSIYQDGADWESKQQWQEALRQYEAAARIDDRFADLQFCMGRCLAALGRFKEAREHFLLACDLDVLRFRADSRINAAIRKVAAEQEAAGVRFVDAEQTLANSDLAVGGIPGDGLFYEHVHFTFDGNYWLARSMLDQVREAVPQLAAIRAAEACAFKRSLCAIAGVDPLGRARDGHSHGEHDLAAAVYQPVGPCGPSGLSGKEIEGSWPCRVRAAKRSGQPAKLTGCRSKSGRTTGKFTTASAGWRWRPVNMNWPPSIC